MMKPWKRFNLLSYLMLIPLLVLAVAVQADHHEGEQQHEMNEEQAAMMKAWQEAMTPGKHHEKLAKAAGNWKMTVKYWMNPEGEPQVSEGTAHRKMVLGGRCLVEDVEANMMGQEFMGHGMTGYDNVKGEYWSTWTDNMSTGIMVSEGNWNEEKNAMVMKGEYVDPMTKEAKTMKMIGHFEGDDKEHWEFWDDRGGEMVKTMEITYVRM